MMEQNGSIPWPDTAEGKQIQTQLADPKTLAGLSKLLNRVDELEKTVARLSDLLERGPTMLAMATDTLDEEVRNGFPIEERLGNALKIADKLTAPSTVAHLDKMFTLLDQLPGTIGMVTDMADEAIRKAQANGIQWDERLNAGLKIAEKLTQPAMVEKVEKMVEFMEKTPDLIHMVADIADDSMREFTARGLDPIQIFKQGIDTADKVSKMMQTDSMKELMTSGLLEEEAISVVGAMGKSLKEAKLNPQPPLPPLKTLKALRDPEVQQTMGFLVGFAKAFGKQLK